MTIFVAALVSPALAAAAEFGSRDARAVRTLIEAQLAAFAAGDAERAFSYASPSIRSQFGDAINFMAMVQSAYPMVIRPAAVVFFQPVASDDSVIQTVQLRDRAGKLWRATYQLQQLADKGWRINGVVVAADSGNSST